MTCATKRDTQRARPTQHPLLPGDLVTCKTIPDLPFVVDDQGYADPNKVLLSRVADGGRDVVKLAVGLHEIATATRPSR